MFKKKKINMFIFIIKDLFPKKKGIIGWEFLKNLGNELFEKKKN